MVRSIKLSPKYVVVSVCLLLVLVAGLMAQTAAQSTNMSIDLTVYGLTFGETGGMVYFQTVVNGEPYCIFGPQTGFYPPGPITVAPYEGYPGECDALPPYDYVGAGGGGLVTSGYHPGSVAFVVTGTITIELQGEAPAYAFTLVVDLIAGGINIQSHVTGNLNIQPGVYCALSNLASQYASVTGAGFDLNLQLLANTGTCGPRVLDLGLTFGNAAAAVGGVVIPINTFAVLAPWLAVIGLAGCIGTVLVAAKKRRQ
jgi:hypothetical protein